MRAQSSGFLYVELLVALFLLTLALVGIVPMFFLAARTNAIAAEVTSAATLAHDKAEELRVEDWNTLIGGAQETIRLRRITYRRSWVVESDTPFADLKTVTVSVQPLRARQEARRSVSVRFYRAAP